MLDKLKAVLAVVKTQLSDIWNRGKMVFLAIGALILTLEFQKLKEFLLVYAGKREIKKDESKDQKLAEHEKLSNDQADALVQKAKQETAADDWNTK